jgi:dTDP-4-amino-4,6-dideoxygalactose transaminase
MKVPLLDLRPQWAALRDEIVPALERVFEHQLFVNGPEIEALEKVVARYCESADAVCLSSGTDALLVAFMCLGIGPGDEVITTPYTFFATAGCIWRVGARPVFVDIEPDTFNIDPARIEAAIGERTRAIVPVHLFGQMAEMQPILALAQRHGLQVVEDAAQAIGASQRGRKAGSLGAAGCLSFFPSKNLGGLGDGGMLTVAGAGLAGRARQCRNHGSPRRYYHRFVGGNFRLDTIQAAALLVKMRHLDEWHAARRAHAARYDDLLAGVPEVVRPVLRPGNESVVNQYVVRVPRRDACMAFLRERGIGCEVYYPLCLHEQECFASLGHRRGDFPEAERAAAESLALPVYPELTDDQLRYVADGLKDFLAGAAT